MVCFPLYYNVKNDVINDVIICRFCVNADYFDEKDELWHWITQLSAVTHVILVRTRCITPSQALDNLVALLPNPPRVVCVLARDHQLNPRGGGAMVEAWGVEDLVDATRECIERRKSPASANARSKLLRQVKR